MTNAYDRTDEMSKFDTVYTASLVVGNAGTAGVLYLLGNPLFTVVLGALGFVVLAAAVLTKCPVARFELTTA
jgi:multisubunit Na+/H+ antiporter MnhG subunit